MSTEDTIQFYLITFTILLTPIIIYSIVKFISYRREKERTRIENELCAQQNTDKANRTVKYLMEKTIGKELTVIVFNFNCRSDSSGFNSAMIFRIKSDKTLR